MPCAESEILKRTDGWARRILRQWGYSGAPSEDALQEARLRAWRHSRAWPEYKHHRLGKIVRTALLDTKHTWNGRKGQKVVRRLTDEVERTLGNEDDSLARVDLEDEVRHVLAALPQKYRSILELRLLGASSSAIARKLGRSRQALQYDLNLARKMWERVWNEEKTNKSRSARRAKARSRHHRHQVRRMLKDIPHVVPSSPGCSPGRADRVSSPGMV